MIEKEIKNILKIFNDKIDYIINAFTKYNLDEHAVIFLVKKTTIFLSFTQRIVIKILLKILNSGSHIVYKKINLTDIDEMTNVLFEKLSISLTELLNPKSTEKQLEHMDDIINNLTILKNIITTLGIFALSVIEFQADLIKEKEFWEKYRDFRADILGYKKNLDDYLNPEIVDIPIT